LYVPGTDTDWTYPAAFVGTLTRIDANKTGGSGAVVGLSAGIGLTSTHISGLASRNRGVQAMVVTAEGRWF
jgi:hypothetical protein